MAIQLDGARRAVERVMSDSCTIRRFASKADETTLNRTTGKITRNVGTQIYSGPCLISQRRSTAQSQYVDQQIGMAGTALEYNISIRHTAPAIRPGDEVIINRSGDKTLPSRRLIVTSVDHKTLLVWRTFTASDVETARG